MRCLLPAARLPAVIPPQLVAPELSSILQAAAQAARPPPDLCPPQHGPLVKAAQRLQVLASGLYQDEKQLQEAFLKWHNDELGLGLMTRSKPRASGGTSLAADKPQHDGMLIVPGNFVVSLLKCKSDTGGGEPLVQSLRYYQMHYRDGADWVSSDLYRSDTLLSLVLLLEGPRLSFHAVWTLYQNRVAYTPLTPVSSAHPHLPNPFRVIRWWCPHKVAPKAYLCFRSLSFQW